MLSRSCFARSTRKCCSGLTSGRRLLMALAIACAAATGANAETIAILDVGGVEVTPPAATERTLIEEVVVACSVRLARDHSADAVLGSAVHFHHMRDGMVRSAVEWLRAKARRP
jgi:hypothetical protein